MTQPLTSFWPIFATKSDGHDVVNVKGRVIRNGPTQEQLDRTPNEQGQCDYYRLIEKDDPKHIDWRKKLGGMLLREIGGKQHEEKWQQTILWDFPENYQLYEHIKTKADGQTKTVKNHSGGGHDRQDAYLYGYPKGPRKRYRSPADFFPHLLWLCTDEKSDYQNCTCKMCSPVQLDVPKPAVKAEVKNEPAVVVKEEPAKPAAVQTPSAASHTVAVPAAAPARRSISGPPTQSPIAKPVTPVAAPTQAPIQPQIRAPAIQQSTPLPQPRGAEQLTDGRYGLFICRVGEVVWFFRPKTSAWGLGLVLRRWVTKDNTNSKSYLVQPLSHPYDNPTPEVVTADEHLKPWLAWSAPACTFEYLQRNPQLRYDQVDWNALLTGQYGQGIADVDASILAAKAIDITYTLSERVKTSPSPTGEDRHYNCVFLGAEKIWRGDPVRIRVGPGGVDLMVVMDIVERVSAQKQATSQSPSQVWILGDIYSYSTIPVSDPSNLPPNPQDANPNLPHRMREDMGWRNRALIPQAQTLAYWKLIQAGTRVEIADIKGRWYETSLLFQESFLKAVKANEGGNGIWMNARGDAAGIGRATGVVVGDRVMAFGNAVPKGTQLVEGIDAPNQSRQAGAEMHDMDMSGGMHGGTGPDGFSLDDFMNVEHMDDANVDFGNNFNF